MPYELPDPDALVVALTDLGVASGLDSGVYGDELTAAGLAAQSDVEAYLGRVITPVAITVTGVASGYGDNYLFTPVEYPVLGLSTVTVETVDGVPTGLYTVVYVAGLDAATDPLLRPIRRYVTAAAANAPEIVSLWQATGAKGPMTAVSTDGQSAAWSAATRGGGGDAGSGVPGALPTLGSLDRWRLAGRRVYQRPGTTFQRAYDGGLGL